MLLLLLLLLLLTPQVRQPENSYVGGRL